jgi:hypothetical protein
MRACGIAVSLIAGILVAAAAQPARAQTTYVCALNGRSWPQAQPCPEGATTQHRIAAPLRSDASPPPSPAGRNPSDRPPAHLQFQSPRCAELGEAVRTGASRGLGRPALQELYEAYRQQCGDEEARARNLLLEERNRQRDAREREERAARLELDRDKLNREQCAEMKRILQTKRQRLETMTAGERGDFERFEATWRARCTP